MPPPVCDKWYNVSHRFNCENGAMKFQIQITETLQRLVEVDARSAKDAELFVCQQYRSGEIVLDSSDHIDTDVSWMQK